MTICMPPAERAPAPGIIISTLKTHESDVNLRGQWVSKSFPTKSVAGQLLHTKSFLEKSVADDQPPPKKSAHGKSCDKGTRKRFNCNSKVELFSELVLLNGSHRCVLSDIFHGNLFSPFEQLRGGIWS